MPDFIIHEGARVSVCGYAAVFNSLSVPLDEHGGKRELIRPGAFTYALRNLRESTTCTMHHMNASGTIGSIFHRTLRLWADDLGLAFSCGPLEINSKNVWAVRSIVSGGARGCSWRALPAEMKTEVIDGESVRVIRRIEHLSHVSPGTCGLYPAAGTWCSHENPYDLPRYLKALARHWQANRPAAKPSLVTRAEAPGPQAPSRAEQAAKAYHEAKTQRLTKVAQARTRARQRRAA